MTSKKQRMIVYGVSIQLLLVAIVCYAAFPVKAPEEPFRLMYHTNAGKVLFDHQSHTAATGYALNCTDCHHDHPEGEPIDPIACGQCHPPRPAGQAVPETCLDCHDASEVENPEIMKRSDAFHAQCIGCHEEFGAGPGSGPENCSKCHVL